MIKILCWKCGESILVDDYDFKRVSEVHWSCKNGLYFVSSERKYVPIANFIKGEPEDNRQVWDHIDRNNHNNQRSNLRLATHAQNCANKEVTSKNVSGFKGVFFRSRNRLNKYEAQIRKDGSTAYLGAFRTAEEAAKVYDKWAKELFGEFAVLNFPDTQQ